jgi:TRAP-type transport system periplasmic protein
MKFRGFVAGAALAAAALALATPGHAQPTTLQIHGSFVAELASSRAMEIFKSEAARLSGGTIEVELTPFTLGSGGARQILDDVRTQKIFGAWLASANLSRLVPEVGVMGLPFVFDNYDQVARVLKGPVGALIESKMAEKGFIALGWMQLGARNVTNSKKPIRTLGDLKGLKMRVQINETHIAIFRALGTNPVALDVKDLLVALRQRDIDGEENPYSVIHSNKYYETQKYLSNTAHTLDLVAVIASREAFMSLNAQQQKVVREAVAIAVARQWKMAAADEASALVKLKEKGMQFDPVPPATRVAMRRATAVVIDDARKRFGDELVNRVLATSKRGASAATNASSESARSRAVGN